MLNIASEKNDEAVRTSAVFMKELQNFSGTPRMHVMRLQWLHLHSLHYIIVPRHYVVDSPWDNDA